MNIFKIDIDYSTLLDAIYNAEVNISLPTSG